MDFFFSLTGSTKSPPVDSKRSEESNTEDAIVANEITPNNLSQQDDTDLNLTSNSQTSETVVAKEESVLELTIENDNNMKFLSDTNDSVFTKDDGITEASAKAKADRILNDVVDFEVNESKDASERITSPTQDTERTFTYRPKARSAVLDRFDSAVEEQKIKEENKLKMLRAVRKASLENRPRTNTSTNTLRNIWSNAVNMSKQNEQSRFEKTRTLTLTDYSAATNGYVKAKIGEWEQLFMQLSASREQIERTVQAAKKRVRQISAQKEKMRESLRLSEDGLSPGIQKNLSASLDEDEYEEIDETFSDSSRPYKFKVGSTHIYSATVLGQEANEILTNYLKLHNGQPQGLACGVYGENSQPPVELIGVAMLGDDGETLLALTVTVQDGYVFDESAYGLKKVAVFLPKDNIRVLERVVELIPELGWENWKKNKFEILDTSAKNALNIGDGSDSETADRPVRKGSLKMTLAKISAKSSTSGSNSFEIESESIFRTDSMFDGLDADDDEEEDMADFEESGHFKDDGEDVEPIQFGRPSTFASESDLTSPKVFGTLDTHRGSFMSRSFAARNEAWRLDDERENGLLQAESSRLALNLNDIIGCSSATNCLVLLNRLGGSVVITESSDAVEPPHNMVMFSQLLIGNFCVNAKDLQGTLKAAFTNSKHIVVQDKFFEWTRGAAMSGWMYKWPMKSQQKGRKTKRFFVLRDNILSYFKDQSDSNDMENPEASLKLTEGTTVGYKRTLFRQCIVVKTPFDTLWTYCENSNKEAETNESERWIQEIQLGINQMAKKHLFSRKALIETVWHNEEPLYHCVHVDAAVFTNNDFFTVALFRYGSTSKYQVEVGLSGGDRFQLQLLHVNGDFEMNLTHVKVCGGVVVIGGSSGFVGVGLPGDPNLAVMHCIPAVTPSSVLGPEATLPEVSPNGKTKKEGESSGLARKQKLARGHADDSVITTVASAHESGYFVTGDDQGLLCLWKLTASDDLPEAPHVHRLPSLDSHGSFTLEGEVEADMPTGAILHSSVHIGDLGGKAAGRVEYIRSLQFLSNEEHLIVSTNERLILVVIPMTTDYVQQFGNADGEDSKSITAKLQASEINRQKQKLFDQDDSAIFTQTVCPRPGFVLECKRENGHEVFVNVTHNEQLPVHYPNFYHLNYISPLRKRPSSLPGGSNADKSHHQSRHSLDSLLAKPSKSPLGKLLVTLEKESRQDAHETPSNASEPEKKHDGNVRAPFIAISDVTEYEYTEGKEGSCDVYTVVVSSALYRLLDPNSMRELSAVVVQRLNGARGESLDVNDFNIMKLKTGFKGDYNRANQMLVVNLSPAKDCYASLATHVRPREFFSWTELDRVLRGTSAIFSLSVVEKYKPKFPGSSFAKIDRKITIWKVAREEEEEEVADKVTDCSIYRFEWNDEMLRVAFQRMQYISSLSLNAHDVKRIQSADKVDMKFDDYLDEHENYVSSTDKVMPSDVIEALTRSSEMPETTVDII